MKKYWNDRFGATEYAYGIEPNEFFKREIEQLVPGKLLLIAEGEGRNAIYAAKLGWEVTAIDFSTEAQSKALKLAHKNKVNIKYQVCDVTEYKFIENEFNAIGLIYAHFSSHIREEIHRKCILSLKKGGHIILEAFSPAQLKYQSFGPKDPAMLYSPEMLTLDFSPLQSIICLQKSTILAEGPFHNGQAEIIRYLGKKI